jgi:hypothetical protein
VSVGGGESKQVGADGKQVSCARNRDIDYQL